ncbi:MBL fold metallo-hydrolase [Sorangium sp. So ce1182]|uniref:MBL fold metallo-hydrolase n=1 Tax=Sorangium sp. So ce1182 TaxID=3133334 RepID=UPI003F629FA5
MRIHHLNCISTCPIGGALMDGQTLGLRGRLTCHCLLLETDSGLVLVDTGLGLLDVSMARKRLSRFFLFLVRPEFRAEMTAHRQIQRLGFRPEDVRHIVLTHLDFDHAGGLDDFPGAEVHLLADERDAALARRTLLDRMRYRPAQWSTQPSWIAYPSGGERWFGFEGARAVGGLKDEVLLVPLIGHTLGHAGVAVRSEGGWLLLAGDAYFYHREMDLARPRCTPGLRFYQVMMEKDRGARLENQRRLRALREEHGDEVTLVCSHDVVEFERITGRSHAVPAGGAGGAGGRGVDEPEPQWGPAPSPAAGAR